MRLFTTANTKTAKNEIPTLVLHLAPHKLVGIGNVCPAATRGCIASCLNTAGRGRFEGTQTARIKRTLMYYQQRTIFLAQLAAEIHEAREKNGRIAVRLNGTSDIDYTNMKLNGLSLFDMFEDVIFYDYTKVYKRFLQPIPKNYHLTFSYSGERDYYKGKANEIAANVLSLGYPVAVVFRNSLPETFLGYPVVDGDKTDERFLNGAVIIGLTAKGKAKHDTSGFVVDEPEEKYERTAAGIAGGVILTVFVPYVVLCHQGATNIQVLGTAATVVTTLAAVLVVDTITGK